MVIIALTLLVILIVYLKAKHRTARVIDRAEVRDRSDSRRIP